MIQPEVRWERMFPDQLDAAFARRPLVYFSYGLCEPHGPQNALGLDALKAHALCVAAARAHGGIVAPPDFWHIHESGHYAVWARRTIGDAARPWLTALPAWQHFKNVLYHIRQADRLGFHAAILLTGHYGPNWRDLKKLIALVQPHVGTRLESLPDFEANTPGFDGDNRSGGDHAGKVETSLMWALDPTCTDVSRFPKDDSLPFAMGADARKADKRIGERMVADEVRWLGDKANALLAAYAQLKPTHRLLSFEQVECLWDQVIRPELKTFESMQTHLPGDTEPPADSPWRVNWEIPDRG